MYTVLIATVPGDPFLAAALESIYTQSAPPARVEVITDVDQALPPQWHREIVRRFPRVFFRVQRESGMITALNHGLQSLRTPYVAFLDSDDRWLPEKQERQLALLQRDPEVDAVTCLAVKTMIGPGGARTVSRAVPSCLFTSTTFRSDVFVRFGTIDTNAGHYVWLYRWWSRARRMGIITREVSYLGLERRIHGANSWITGNSLANSNLLSEIRQIVSERRKV